VTGVLGEQSVVFADGQGTPQIAPVLPLRETVPFPEALTPLAVGQDRSVRLINDVLAGDRTLVMVASRNAELETPGPEDLYDVGVVGVIARMLRVPDGTLRLLVQGGRRVRIVRWTQEEPYLAAEIEEVPETDNEPSTELTALMRNVQSTFTAIVEQVPYLPEELQVAVANVDDPANLSHLIAASLRPRSCASASPGSSFPRRRAARSTASSTAWRTCPPRPPSTASSAPTWSGSRRCPGTRRRRTTSTSPTRARCSTPTTTACSRSRTASSSSSPCGA
jgi:Lon protease-like protein